MKQTCFSYFWCGFKIKTSDMHEYVMNNQEHIRTIKNIQTYAMEFK